MPELPEVELISRSLDSLVKGRTIVSARLLRQRLAPDTSPRVFAGRLENKLIDHVHRRGKHILFDLSKDTTLLVHLRMSGRFSVLGGDSELPKFTHALFYLDDGTQLAFDDQRHFGLMKILRTSDLGNTKELKKLAPEPFSPDFSPEYLASALKASKRPIKEFLIDQTRVCGLGNIYASEALFAAAIHPALQAHRLSRARAARLYGSILGVLEEAITYASGRPVDAQNLEGNYFSGNGEASWLVYDREGEACRKCETAISRLKQGGRSTYYCRRCQRR